MHSHTPAMNRCTIFALSLRDAERRRLDGLSLRDAERRRLDGLSLWDAERSRLAVFRAESTGYSRAFPAGRRWHRMPHSVQTPLVLAVRDDRLAEQGGISLTFRAQGRPWRGIG